jgi:hypothetical protein
MTASATTATSNRRVLSYNPACTDSTAANSGSLLVQQLPLKESECYEQRVMSTVLAAKVSAL